MKKATTSKKRIQKKSKPVDQQLLDSARTLVNFSKLSPPNQRAAIAMAMLVCDLAEGGK